jgi:alpha-L-rhamnosidase
MTTADPENISTSPDDPSRRRFMTTAVGSAALLALPGETHIAPPNELTPEKKLSVRVEPLPDPHTLLDLAPAAWLWYPSERTVQNTVVLFRKSIHLETLPLAATGWIAADSRYRLFVNGTRVQFGPAPSDPRFMEADPVDLTKYLRVGENVIGAEVLYYGVGEGTWTFGKPGFICRIDAQEGAPVVTDKSWQTMLCRAWPPGQYKRWYVRAFQEEFDARLYPSGWNAPGFVAGTDWREAMVLHCPPNKPAICSTYVEYQHDIALPIERGALLQRSIPLLIESEMQAPRFAGAFGVRWRCSPEEYFLCVTPDAYEVLEGSPGITDEDGGWRITLADGEAAVLTFEFNEQGVGWPHFDIDAPQGTIIELLVHEAHDPANRTLMNTHFHAWTRFICREGKNTFETFDYESLRWLQLHVRNAHSPVLLKNVGIRRRAFPFHHEPEVNIADPAVNRLMSACVNTLRNSVQETAVDGMARERQQYSGDGSHQLHPVYLGFGDPRPGARFVRTFGQGMMHEGYFFDCWPAYDRLARLMERQLGLSVWGPLLDHGIGFVFDCWWHYMHTGDITPVREVFPQLRRFVEYLGSLCGTDGLLPVEKLGVPSVYMDHNAYTAQRHKRCAFNLYAVAMLRHAFVPLCETLGGAAESGGAATELATRLLNEATRTYWDATTGCFVVNKPWSEESPRFCDRSSATAILFDFCPKGNWQPSAKLLEETPPEMGFSYPANAIWRLWALAKARKGEIILNNLRTRWASMSSVKLNNTVQEFWKVTPDSGWQWSHSALAPLIILYQGLMGVRPLAPGYKKYEVRPLPCGETGFAATAHLPIGDVRVSMAPGNGKTELRIDTPDAGVGELVLGPGEHADLPPIGVPDPIRQTRYLLPKGRSITMTLKGNS